MDYQLYPGDCLDVMATLESGSINLIATDLPYFGVKDNDWDNAWPTRDAFLAWVGRVCDEWKRLLAPNGSVYAFASPQMAWYVEGVIRERFNVLNRITWAKDAQPGNDGWHKKANKESLRQFFTLSEQIVFAEHIDAHAFLRNARLSAGLSSNDAGSLFPSMNGGATGAVRNWELGLNLPSKEQYDLLSKLYPLPPYNDVIRTFNATPDAPYTDVWTFPTVNAYPGKHPTEKPLSLMEHLVSLSSRPGDTVLDCCMGHGTTGIAAGKLGRRFVGIELDAGYFAEASTRIAAAYGDWDKARKVRKGRATDLDALPLFA